MPPSYSQPAKTGYVPTEATIQQHQLDYARADSPIGHEHASTRAVHVLPSNNERYPEQGREASSSYDLPPANATVAIRQPTFMPPRRPKSNVNTAGGFRFHVVDHPDKLKDKREVQKNRRHVMHDWLSKEHKKPMSSYARFAEPPQIRKRKRADKPSFGTSDNPGHPAIIFHGARSATASPTNSISSCDDSTDRCANNAFDSETSGHQAVAERMESCQLVIALTDASKRNPPLVPGISGRFRNNTYLGRREDTVPFPLTRLGGDLNPFDAWPKFLDPDVDVNKLKWKCSCSFGSRGIARHWVPTLLRARHAFLSTICISSAHDDLMSRAVQTPHMRSPVESVERIRVRHEVIWMINESLNDPVLKTADVTIIAVLHLLNAEVMGCDDQVMRVHQQGLHDMVRQRGGLGKLDVNGQFASILTITNYMIAALRETTPHSDYMNYALKQDTRPPIDSQAMPESPLYHRRCGYLSIPKTVAPSSNMFELLDETRKITDAFVARSSPLGCKKLWTPTLTVGGLNAFDNISGLVMNVFAFPTAEELTFRTTSDRYTYEAIRLSSRIYGHALSSHIPLSEAAVQLSAAMPALHGPLGSTTPSRRTDARAIHVDIKDALVRTELAGCWGHMAGVLFWVTLVAGASANPQSAGLERGGGGRGETNGEEEARMWLAAVAVRCSIVLSFEFGGAMLETLKTMVAIQETLAAR